MTERRADEATRDVNNWLKCYYMQGRVGEIRWRDRGGGAVRHFRRARFGLCRGAGTRFRTRQGLFPVRQCQASDAWRAERRSASVWATACACASCVPIWRQGGSISCSRRSRLGDRRTCVETRAQSRGEVCRKTGAQDQGDGLGGQVCGLSRRPSRLREQRPNPRRARNRSLRRRRIRRRRSAISPP